MRKEQLIRICLAMLLASTTLMLSSCKKEPKEKDPKEALVNTRWKTDMNIPGLDIEDEDYPATVKLSSGVNQFIQQFIMKVNWETNILLIYAQEDGTVLPMPMMGFRLVK